MTKRVTHLTRQEDICVKNSESKAPEPKRRSNCLCQYTSVLLSALLSESHGKACRTAQVANSKQCSFRSRKLSARYFKTDTGTRRRPRDTPVLGETRLCLLCMVHETAEKPS